MRSLGLVFILAAPLAACGGTNEASDPPAIEPQPTSTAAPETLAPPEPAGPRVERDSFVLAATPSEAGYASGQAGVVAIELTPRAGWHVNVGFPTSVDLEGAAELGFAKPRLERADAVAFEEQRMRFEAAITPTAAGARTVDATVHFAMCTEETCVPQDVRLSLPIVVR